MRAALNGYFWDQPRTGSGQYLRHLWACLNAPPYSDHDTFALLRPRGPRRHGSRLSRLAGRVGSPGTRVGKLLWEQGVITTEARRLRARLLHVPYLAAPLVVHCPVVVTAHDVIPWVLPAYAGSVQMRLYLAMSAAGVKRARLVIADSEASRRDAIRALGLHPGKVHTVHLGVEAHPRFSDEELARVRARYGLPEQYAFYMGGFDRRKNVPLLLRAWRGALLRREEEWCSAGADRPVLAIGGAVPEPGGIFPDVRGTAASLGWGGPGSPVRFVGSIPEADKPLLMAAARLFVYPSAYEGFGLDPLEAMSVGCPVVSSSGGSLKEVVADGGLLVPPDDEAALSRAIERAWTDEEVRATLTRKGREQASKFTWEKTARETYKLYHKAVVVSR